MWFTFKGCCLAPLVGSTTCTLILLLVSVYLLQVYRRRKRNLCQKLCNDCIAYLGSLLACSGLKNTNEMIMMRENFSPLVLSGAIT
jgi:hypothetical protein